MARKVPVRRTVCPECGEDLLSSHKNCPGCGVNILHPSSSEDEVASIESVEDVPDRASYLFWFDGLLFTSAWYIPVILIILAASSLFIALYPGGFDVFVISLPAVALAVFVSWLYLRARRRNRNRFRM